MTAPDDDSGRRPPWIGGTITLVAGAVAWCLPFWIRLARVPTAWWIARDDGVITLSHARNLADHGSVGVSPGADRVEGFSSPLQFAAAAVVERFGDPSARSLGTGLFIAAMIGSGAVLTYGAQRWWQRSAPRRNANLVAVATVGFLGVLMCLPWTTTGWLGSGMENPMVVLAMACVLAGVVGAPTTRVDLVLVATGAAMLMIARVEFAAFTAPVLAAIAVSLTDDTPRLLGWSRGVTAVLITPVLFAAIVHVTRRAYFGSWLPNTAIVQNREAGLTQLVAIAAIGLLFIVLLVRARLLQIVSVDDRHMVSRLGILGAIVLALGIAWLDATGRLTQPLTSVLVIPGVIEFTVLVVSALGLASALSSAPLRPYHWVFGALALLPLTQYLVTGAARLDDNRVSGLAVPVLIVWSVLGVADAAVAATAEREARMPTWVRGGLALVCCMGLIAVGSTLRADRARPLNYEISWAEAFAADAAAFGSEHLAAGALPITANPDLGKLSFEKQSMIVDLGWLGDPVLATLRADHPDLMQPYLRDVAVPDLVNIGSGWSCEYRGWLEHPAFVAEYSILGQPGAEWVRDDSTCPFDGRRATWVRVVDDGEFELTIRVVTSGDPASVVRDALEECSGDAGGPLRCQPVRRAVWRASGSLRGDGSFDAVVDEFSGSPSSAFDRPSLARGPGWWVGASDAIAELLSTAERG